MNDTGQPWWLSRVLCCGEKQRKIRPVSTLMMQRADPVTGHWGRQQQMLGNMQTQINICCATKSTSMDNVLYTNCRFTELWCTCTWCTVVCVISFQCEKHIPHWVDPLTLGTTMTVHSNRGHPRHLFPWSHLSSKSSSTVSERQQQWSSKVGRVILGVQLSRSESPAQSQPPLGHLHNKCWYVSKVSYNTNCK